ncbi:formyltransferase family protein [Verrucomicrobia bacterium]|nr:formyltransferase family protein [Verrucomicrobiota bacterium]
MNVVILSPINNSLYTRLVIELCRREPGINVTGVILRRAFNWTRFQQEWKRDGSRLIKKIWEKLLLDNLETSVPENVMTQGTLAKQIGLQHSQVSKLSKAYSIPICEVDNFNVNKAIKFMSQCEPTVAVFTGGGLIRHNLLNNAGLGVLNVHLGLLPDYRGMDVVEWPILMKGLEGLKSIGLTLHYMDKGVDTGPILETREFGVLEKDDFHIIRLRLAGAMTDILMKGLKSIRDSKQAPQEQNIKAGKQYYVCHPRMTDIAHKKLANSLKKRHQN